MPCTTNAPAFKNNGDQRAVRIPEGYTDHQGGTDFFGYPKVKEPDLTAGCLIRG